jgi:hypothetical protein
MDDYSNEPHVISQWRHHLGFTGLRLWQENIQPFDNIDNRKK